ncbi:hypothetical protein CSC17_5253 [Klebsiella oxytoca]|nr:hypothetical protein CSC17_5253 [Klebsiella oxytoca]CCG29359.1 hypothetical protein [Klebsiella aerogenes EA1509E]
MIDAQQLLNFVIDRGDLALSIGSKVFFLAAQLVNLHGYKVEGFRLVYIDGDITRFQ